jgi:hypothetical protein
MTLKCMISSNIKIIQVIIKQSVSNKSYIIFDNKYICAKSEKNVCFKLLEICKLGFEK